MKILIGTHNPGKLDEYKRFFADFDIEFVYLDEVGILDEAPEVEESLEEISLSKARYYAEKSGMHTMADDVGLFVEALNGKPGIRAKDLAKTDAERINTLLEMMKDVPREKRDCYFRGVLTFYDPDQETHVQFSGKSTGRILEKPVFSGGFGYDPIFFSIEKQKAYSELTRKEKSDVSYRGKMFRKVWDFLDKKRV